MIFQNNRNYFSRRQVYFKGGGGSSGDTYDKAYNARMASIAEAQQSMAQDYFDFYKSDYQPMEREQIAANREMIPYETELSKEKIQAEMDLLPGQVALGKAQNESALALLPGQTELTQMQIDDSMAAIGEKAPVRQAFFEASLNGVDVESRANRAAADAAHAFMSADGVARRNTARMGVNPNSGRFADMANTNALNRAKTIGGATTQARFGAEAENYQRLSNAMGY